MSQAMKYFKEISEYRNFTFAFMVCLGFMNLLSQLTKIGDVTREKFEGQRLFCASVPVVLLFSNNFYQNQCSASVS